VGFDKLALSAPAFSLAMPAGRARRVNAFEAQVRSRGLEP
jgi:hypothetical protein